MPKIVKSIVLTGNGTNCEREMAHACRLAGSDEVDIVYIHEILNGEKRLDVYHFLNLPGGFLDGDDLGSAKAGANRIVHAKIKGSGEPLRDQFLRFIREGKLAIHLWEHRHPWMNLPFFLFRAGLYFAIWILLAFAALMLVGGWLSHHEPGLPVVLSLTGLLFIVLAGMFGTLTIRDEEDGLVLRYGPVPMFWKRILYADITSVEPEFQALSDEELRALAAGGI